MGKSLFLVFAVASGCLFHSKSFADSNSNLIEPDWSAGVDVPENGRANIYNLNSSEMEFILREGKLKTQFYPVTVTGILPPYNPIKKMIEDKSGNPLKEILRQIVRGVSGFKNFNSVLKRLGLHKYPKETDSGVYQVPYPNNIRPDHLMGFGTLQRKGASGFTFSCAACHSANLFGKTVLGMSNRFPRANDFFVKAKQLLPSVNPWIFQKYTGATNEETQLLEDSKVSLARVEVKSPIQLGLDTSLAQVSLSLNRRNNDDYATPSEYFEAHPRGDILLDDMPADSKPAVWWNVKFKNRWLSDGSVLSGNPIFTNIIWNEIGRGADLKVLEKWLADNNSVVQELTTAVFASEAPRITDFFPADRIDLSQAKHGEEIFNKRCSKCHGEYVKGWSDSAVTSKEEQLKTLKVIPKENTPVHDVGTDSYRRRGMKSLEKLNDLSISKTNNIVIKEQKGYVPPPLVGIWARWPYFHNNSVPSLCALLTASSKRPVVYYAGEANDTEKDFDFQCNGYPLADKTPESWKKPEYLYDVRRPAMGNQGHDEGIFLKNGQELLTPEDKRALVQYLQTL